MPLYRKSRPSRTPPPQHTGHDPPRTPVPRAWLVGVGPIAGMTTAIFTLDSHGEDAAEASARDVAQVMGRLQAHGQRVPSQRDERPVNAVSSTRSWLLDRCGESWMRLVPVEDPCATTFLG